jgi:hypothetical protein
MALVQQATGTQAATLDTEHSLSTRTDGKTYVLCVNLTNMVNGDIVLLRAKVKPLTGSTAVLAYSAAYAHAQTQKAVYSVPIPAVHSVEFTLEQTDGTGRNFEWSVISLD